MNKSEELLEIIGGFEDQDNHDWHLILGKLVKHLKPKQIIELGGQDGYSTRSMLENAPKDCHIFSVDILPKWATLPDHPQVTKIVGDDGKMEIWEGIDVDLGQTDFWEIDSDHSYEHIKKQWEIYSPFFKKGVVIAIDDLNSSFTGVDEFWDELEGVDKVEINRTGLVVI